MIDKFVEWQKRKYSQDQRAFLAVVLSSIFIFVFIPSIPLLFKDKIDKILALPQIFVSPINLHLGIPIAVSGLVLFLWTNFLFVKLGKGTQTPIIPTQKLVTVGPFAYCRNPMYLGVILWVIGLGIILNSLSFILSGLIVPFLYLIYIKLIEEKELEVRFGRQYLEYKKKVPFIIPRLRNSL
ncbi:isoprenylcysteine carboxylmethyltransferase family protein [Candidatus Roizmanbacteria bacterium]|nr:isoprenylcysteine carboxylmethyltransferase family protein [Candidatus Roizmanbacteria bacterium]